MAGQGGKSGDRVIVVTGCDENHFHLAADTIASLRDPGPADFDVGFVHVGAAALPAAIAEAVDCVARVDDADFRRRPRQGLALAYLGVKAQLPGLFPGYDAYVWLDGDTWVQNRAGIDTLLEACRHADVALHPENDINYARLPLPDYRSISVYFSLFPELDAGAFNRFAMLNSGVFAARASSPVWPKWSGLLDKIRALADQRPGQFHSDQIPLHYLAVKGEITVMPVSALNNWQIYTAPPTINVARRKLLSPFPPYDELNIVHLAGDTKTSTFRFAEAGEPLTFRYRDIRALFQRLAEERSGDD